MRLLFLSALILLIQNTGISQKKEEKLGDRYFEQNRYLDAISYYLDASAKQLEWNVQLTYKLAESFYRILDYKSAMQWNELSFVMGDSTCPNKLYSNHLDMLVNLGEYSDAISFYEHYFPLGKLSDNQSHANHKLATYVANRMTIEKNVIVNKTNYETLGQGIGVAMANEFIIGTSPDQGDKQNQTVFYSLELFELTDSITFIESKSAQLNLNHNPFYQGTPAYSHTENMLYYTENASKTERYKQGKAKKNGLRDDGYNPLQIYYTCLGNESIVESNEVIRFPHNSLEYDCCFPFYDDTDSMLYFSSNMPGGSGGYDLYRSKKKGNVWLSPENLGAAVNSEKNEIYPVLFCDTLYYASDGKNGIGGFDLFRMALDGKNEIVNMGLPFNSSGDDFGLCLYRTDSTLKKGYFFSNRDDLRGYDRLYYFKTFPKKQLVPDTLVFSASHSITDYPIEYFKVDYILNDSFASSILSDNGTVEIPIDNVLDFGLDLVVKSENHEPLSLKLTEDNFNNEFLDTTNFKLNPIVKKNEVIEIDNIYFDFDKHSIRPESVPILNNVVTFLNAYPDIRIELSAHTDSRGNATYNMNLSELRAKEAFKFLIAKGVDQQRLEYKGYGETKLLNDCDNRTDCSSEEHQLNRRVEIKIL